MCLRKPPVFPRLYFLLWCAFWGAVPAATAQLAPIRVPSPIELDIPYSSENKPGRQFTEEDRRQPLLDGARICREILEAFHAGSASYTITPGDYRFNATYLDVAGNSFALKVASRPHGDRRLA
jgi:hypothetical protein